MRLESKFDLGDKVWKIGYLMTKVNDKCPTCEGKKRIFIKDSDFQCPDCCGRGYHVRYEPQSWKIQELLTVGQIRITKDKKEDKREYMCNETGVGSGSIHYEKDLFHTYEEAQTECDRRNS